MNRDVRAGSFATANGFMIRDARVGSFATAARVKYFGVIFLVAIGAATRPRRGGRRTCVGWIATRTGEPKACPCFCTGPCGTTRGRYTIGGGGGSAAGSTKICRS